MKNALLISDGVSLSAVDAAVVPNGWDAFVERHALEVVRRRGCERSAQSIVYMPE